MAIPFQSGTLGLTHAYIPVPPVPAIISEWASLIPLACHLASPQDDYITAGDVCLTGRLSVPLFPSLGTLWGLARFLRKGPQYFDFASARGGSSRTIWDVKWGSEFLCANGAASTGIAEFILERSQDHTGVVYTRSVSVSDGAIPPNPLKIARKDEARVTRQGNNRDSKDALQSRQQILHVYHFHFCQRQRSLRYHFDSFKASKFGRGLSLVTLSGLAVIFGLIGAYGSATIIFNTIISKSIAWTIAIPRSAGYLRNNEQYDNACMLVASHANATEWSLYIGDRAIVDTLLNKPMVYFPEGKQAQLAARWFAFAHLLQLVTITYVAAQKGWDGICLLMVLLLQYAYKWTFCGDTKAADWLSREGIEVKVRTYEFGWRAAMLGCIQLFSGSKITRWMNSIIVSHPRRDAFLEQIQGEAIEKEMEARLDQHDLDWIHEAVCISVQGAEVIKRDFGFGE